MPATLKIKYFNTFIIREDLNAPTANTALSFPGNTGDDVTMSEKTFHIEESRIKGGFNEPIVGLGARAYAVDKNYKPNRRENTMIYSGIFNSRTGVNDTNVFSIGESITKSVDSAYGSIQKLFAEETNLTIFQENKVSRALIDKDAIFTAEGGSLSTAAKVVIGQIAPYTGEYGISKNPESFAYYGNRKYFTDKNKGVVLRLSTDGLTEISSYGMRSFFRDNLKTAKRIYGMFDIHAKSYILSFSKNENYTDSIETTYSTLGEGFDFETPVTVDVNYKTLSFDDRVNGWTSFFTYQPQFGGSVRNNFFTTNLGRVWHHHTSSNKNTFYGVFNPSILQAVSNQNPSMVKRYQNINYEGTSNWRLIKFESPIDDNNKAKAHIILGNLESKTGSGTYSGFTPIEKKYYAHIRQDNSAVYSSGKIISTSNKAGLGLLDISDVKGFFADFTLEHRPMQNNGDEDTTKHAELFSVGLNYEQSLY
jgi:hypothetical protein